MKNKILNKNIAKSAEVVWELIPEELNRKHVLYVCAASRLGLYSKGCQCLSGEDVDHLDLQELSNIVPRVRRHTHTHTHPEAPVCVLLSWCLCSGHR